MEPILQADRRGHVTLVYSSHDQEHNNAVALKAYVAAKMSGRGGVHELRSFSPTCKEEHGWQWNGGTTNEKHKTNGTIGTRIRIIEWVVHWQSSQRSSGPGRKLKVEFWTTTLRNFLCISVEAYHLDEEEATFFRCCRRKGTRERLNEQRGREDGHANDDRLRAEAAILRFSIRSCQAV